MLPRDLLAASRHLVASGKGKPKQAFLRRATSTIYYALFHTVAKECADLIVGSSKATRSKPAWKQVYRSLQHGPAKAACSNKEIVARFPNEIQDFANFFVSMQDKRHAADYDPYERTYKSSVETDIGIADSVIAGLESAATKDRRAFVALVLFRQPPK